MTARKAHDNWELDITNVQDQIKNDTGVSIFIDQDLVDKMVAEVSRMYARRDHEHFNDMVLITLAGYEYDSDVEYTAYERVIDAIFQRRMKYRHKQDVKHGKYAPFAPRTEQDFR